MLMEPSDGGAFVGLKNTVAAWAVPAKNVAMAVNLRALAGFGVLPDADG